MEISQSILCISFPNDKYIPNIISTERSDEKSNIVRHAELVSTSHPFFMGFRVKHGMTIHAYPIGEIPCRTSTSLSNRAE